MNLNSNSEIWSSRGSMPALFFDVESYRDFPIGELWTLVLSWWFVDVGDEGRLRILDAGIEIGGRLDEMCVVEDGTHRGMRRLVHERWPKHGEVCVRGSDGGLVAWVDGDVMTDVFHRVGRLRHPSIQRMELCHLDLDRPKSPCGKVLNPPDEADPVAPKPICCGDPFPGNEGDRYLCDGCSRDSSRRRVTALWGSSL